MCAHFRSNAFLEGHDDRARNAVKRLDTRNDVIVGREVRTENVSALLEESSSLEFHGDVQFDAPAPCVRDRICFLCEDIGNSS